MIYLVGSLFIVSTLSACDDTNNDDTASNEVTLDFGIHVANPEEQEAAFYAVVESFEEENPNININLIGREQSDHIQSVKMQSQSNNLPDIFWMLPASAEELEDNNYLADLSGFLDENPDIVNSFDGMETMIDSFNKDGRQYGLPYQPLVTGFYYNEKILEEHSLEVPETFEDLLEVSNTLSEEGIVTISKGGQDPYSVWSFLTMLSRYGYFDKIDAILEGEEEYTNEDFVNYYEKIEELREAKAFPENVSTQSYFQAVEQFITGNAAFLDSGAWEAQKIEESDIGQHVKFWWGPTFNDGVGEQKLSSVVPSAPLLVNKNSYDNENKKTAIDTFLEFYYGQEGIQIMVDNNIPPMSNLDISVDENESPVFASIINEISRDGWVSQENQPDLVVSEAIGNAIYDSIFGVIIGTYTPEEAAQIVQNQIEESIN